MALEQGFEQEKWWVLMKLYYCTATSEGVARNAVFDHTPGVTTDTGPGNIVVVCEFYGDTVAVAGKAAVTAWDLMDSSEGLNDAEVTKLEVTDNRSIHIDAPDIYLRLMNERANIEEL